MLREKGEFICCFWVASSILPYSKFLFTFFARKNLHDIDKVVVFYFLKKMNIAKKILSLRINLSPCYINKNVIAFLSSDSSERNFINLIEDEKKKTATVIMQRPPVNSLNTELLQQLTSAIKTLEEKKFRGFILSSNSPTVFSAGLDIMEFVSPKEERLRLFWTSLQTMWKTLYMTPMISIAAINGHAPAGGCLLALSCDESIMVKSRATIGLNETLLGIIAPKWFRQLYINTVSFHYADYALKLGKMFTPEEALKLHLVNELVESPSDLNEKAQSEMDKWLKIPDAARRLTKQSMRKQYVDELISYEKQEVEEIVKFVYLEQTQNALGAYVKSLKGAKK